ncbi:hypothetical protein [Streptomyces sp. ISL-11]|uniref:hypothetical protein n=1 Tax=Streptomyces sp. ISL-11 TaxID=2819174 RepID=UPI001BEB662E|nr:hypothetical protein [Streptomyces sp. ISL-11]MBT2384313.1 hypothetical protein [Streptomyces sp. ISL-11]
MSPECPHDSPGAAAVATIGSFGNTSRSKKYSIDFPEDLAETVRAHVDLTGATLSGGTAGDTKRSYGYPAPGTAQPHALTAVSPEGPGAVKTAETYAYDETGNTATPPRTPGQPE